MPILSPDNGATAKRISNQYTQNEGFDSILSAEKYGQTTAGIESRRPQRKCNLMIKMSGYLKNEIFIMIMVFFFSFMGCVYIYDLIVYYTSTGNLVGHFTPDDSMITMRVALNYYRTGMPYFNEGEAVAANTSLFWPILMSPVFAVADPRNAIFLVYFVSISISILTAYLASRYINDWRAILCFLLILFSHSFIVYGGSGMEHVPQAFFSTVGLLFLLRSQLDKFVPATIGFVFVCLSFILRPDTAPLILIYWILWIRAFRKRYFGKIVLVSLLMAIVPISYIVLMNFFYHNIFPNSFYLKSAPAVIRFSNGIEYLANPMHSGPVPVLLATMIIWHRKLSHAQKAIVYMCCGQMFYALLVGGDVFYSGRFFVILLPTVITMFADVFIPRRITYDVKFFRPVLFACFMVILQHPLGFLYQALEHRVPYRNMDDISSQIMLAEIINKKFEPSDGSVGLHYLGIGYHLPNFHVVDFLGKAEPFIAHTDPKGWMIGHNKWDYRYAFEKYDLAVIPMPHRLVAGEARLESTHPYYFMQELAGRLAKPGSGFVYFSPAALNVGNSTWGIYVKGGLAQKLSGG